MTNKELDDEPCPECDVVGLKTAIPGYAGICWNDNCHRAAYYSPDSIFEKEYPGLITGDSE